MTGEHAPPKTPGVHGPPGNWLRLARAGWLVLAFVALAILLTSLPGYVQNFGDALAHTSTGSQGSGAGILALLSGLASLASALLSLGLAAVFFWRRFTDPVAAVLSFYLLLYALVMVGPLEIWSTYWLGDDSLVLRLQRLLVGVPTVALFALFPSGRFVPAWTRLLLLTIPCSIFLLLLPSHDLALLGERTPLGLALLALGLIGLVAAGLYAQMARFRHVSSPAERQQTKWVVYGFALWMGYLLLSSFPYFHLLRQPAGAPALWWEALSVLGWFLSLSIVPVSLTIAVTRYHLWDIDLVINRTLVYVALTACIVGTYALMVGGLGALFHTQVNWGVALVATALVALLFQPLRDRLQRGVNRLLYGHRDEPLEVLSRLGQRVKDTFVLEPVLPAMVETIAQTLKLPYVTIAVQQGDAARTILKLIARGESNAEVAEALTISIKTVRNQVSNIFGKLQIADRAQAVIRAREAGLG